MCTFGTQWAGPQKKKSIRVTVEAHVTNIQYKVTMVALTRGRKHRLDCLRAELRLLTSKINAAFQQAVLIDYEVERTEIRYDRAVKNSHPSRNVLRHRLEVLMGARNMHTEYVQRNMEIRHEVYYALQDEMSAYTTTTPNY